ncbi:MAG: hypothetical protein Q8M31_03905 [Beijerinckiaceae bacterium]|nr:hypothetical protein [Beijerinckiaceae bacterium]
MIDEDTVFACALALWKASALNDTRARDLDREFVEMNDSDREPYLAGAREVLRAYLAAAQTARAQEVAALVEDIGNHLKGRDVGCTSDELHCRTADFITAQAARLAEETARADRNGAALICSERNLDILRGDLAAAEACNAALVKALKPFAIRVYNDNGDISVSNTHTLESEDFIRAYFAHRAALAAAGDRTP